MYLGEVCREDFVLIQSDWSVTTTCQLIERLGPTHVIVHRTVPGDQYYLYSKQQAQDLLKGKCDQTPISAAFNLHEYPSTPTVDAYSDAPSAPPRSVVIKAGHAVGFYDKSLGAKVIFGDNDGTVDPNGSAEDTPPVRVRGGSRNRGSSQVKGVADAAAEAVSRSLVADFPERVRLRETNSLLVSLSMKAGKGISLPVALPRGSVIDVVVQTKRGFVLDGTGEGSLVIDAPQATSPLQFKLIATELGKGKVTVFAFHQQQSQGSITLAPVVVPATDRVGARREHKQAVQSSVHVAQPDLSLMIFENQSNGHPALTFRLSALDPNLSLHMKPFGPVELRVDPLKYFQEFFKDIENLALRTRQEKTIAEKRLALKGCTLFEKLIPENLQVVLWSLRNQIKSVHIESEEPWIPWEICKLEGKENGRLVEGAFFCEAFAISRWLMGTGMKPNLKLNNMALVQPGDSGLENAPSEGSYILSLANDAREVTRVRACYLEVVDEMQKGEYDGWHFTGHGGFAAADPNRSVIALEKGQKLMPEDISGVVRNVGKRSPLVFLNACQLGRSAFSLTGVGGWASRFLEAGAGAFVGAYWSVYDQAAHDFTRTFYGCLLRGINIAKAVQEARLAIKGLEDPTWLAYTVFADPMARVQLGAPTLKREALR